MPRRAVESSWTVLFVPSTSPGALFRFFERRRRQDPALPAVLYASDAVGPDRIRLVRADGEIDVPDWLEARGPLLSTVFPPRVTLLRRDAAGWRFIVWESGAEIERGGGEHGHTERLSLWQRLPGRPRPIPPETAWAQSRSLPLNRRSAPLVDYVTVAQLDQKNLLYENGPRLYRFVL